MCTVLLPPGVNPIVVKYISYYIVSYSYHISYHIHYISYHIYIIYHISYHIHYISYIISYTLYIIYHIIYIIYHISYHIHYISYHIHYISYNKLLFYRRTEHRFILIQFVHLHVCYMFRPALRPLPRPYDGPSTGRKL